MGCGCGGGGSTAGAKISYGTTINMKSIEAARANAQLHSTLRVQLRTEVRKTCPRCSYPMNRFRRVDAKSQRVTTLLLCLNNRCRFQQEET